MPSPTYPSECEQCVTECDLENCDLGTEEQCTDRCIVVPCDDPCLDICGTCVSWPNTLCTGGHCESFEDLVSLLHGNIVCAPLTSALDPLVPSLAVALTFHPWDPPSRTRRAIYTYRKAITTQSI